MLSERAAKAAMESWQVEFNVTLGIGDTATVQAWQRRLLDAGLTNDSIGDALRAFVGTWTDRRPPALHNWCVYCRNHTRFGPQPTDVPKSRVTPEGQQAAERCLSHWSDVLGIPRNLSKDTEATEVTVPDDAGKTVLHEQDVPEDEIPF